MPGKWLEQHADNDLMQASSARQNQPLRGKIERAEDEARRPKKKAKALPKKKGKGKVTPKPIASKRNLTRQLPPVPKSKAIVNSSEDSDDDEDT
jgi:hypothetical protein